MAHIEVPPIEIDLNDYITPNISYTINNNIGSKVTCFDNSENIESKSLDINVTKIVDIDTKAQKALEKGAVLITNTTEEE